MGDLIETELVASSIFLEMKKIRVRFTKKFRVVRFYRPFCGSQPPQKQGYQKRKCSQPGKWTSILVLNVIAKIFLKGQTTLVDIFPLAIYPFPLRRPNWIPSGNVRSYRAQLMFHLPQIRRKQTVISCVCVCMCTHACVNSDTCSIFSHLHIENTIPSTWGQLRPSLSQSTLSRKSL